VLIFSELMDSSSRFLTANADTVYYLSFSSICSTGRVAVRDVARSSPFAGSGRGVDGSLDDASDDVRSGHE
jgi:hypothetical protein